MMKSNTLAKFVADLEKAANGASGACGHFVGNPAILRTCLVKNPILFTECGGNRVGERRIEVR